MVNENIIIQTLRGNPEILNGMITKIENDKIYTVLGVIEDPIIIENIKKYRAGKKINRG